MRTACAVPVLARTQRLPGGCAMTPAEIALLLRIGPNDRALQCPFCGAPFVSATNFALHKQACKKRGAGA